MRRSTPLLLAALPLLALATAPTATAAASFATAHGRFAAPTPGATAVTYSALAPAGSRATVIAISTRATGTSVDLTVHGLLANREYGAHAHTKPCGLDGAAAGPHFQQDPDPVTPSVDPAYANPANEIWLDFTTDRFGNAHAHSRTGWHLGTRRPASVVIHETHTHTAPGHAGTAGARLACLTVAF